MFTLHDLILVSTRQYLSLPNQTISNLNPTVMDGISVHASRQLMGYKLADKIRELLGDEGIKDIDAVIPIPETSNTSAASVSERLGLKFCQGFVKNRYVFRTFMYVNLDTFS